MSAFYEELDRKEEQRRIERLADRPENLHEYQGCVNDQSHGVRSDNDPTKTEALS